MDNMRGNIKNNTLVRLGCFPLINMKRQFLKLFFRYSSDAKKIREFKQSHNGERCFIVGNGPSLNEQDLELLKDEFTIGFNKIIHIFSRTSWRPSMYMCVEMNTLRDCRSGIEQLTMPTLILQEGKKYFSASNSHIIYICNHVPFLVHRYKRVHGIHISKDVANYFIGGETVVFNAIQMAIYMGFSEIYLLGVDHKYSKVINAKGIITTDPSIKDYFGDLPTSPYTLQTVDTVNAAYQVAKTYCNTHHIVIKNLTRGGILEIFDCDTLHAILSNKGVKHVS